jgi:hypothetical protein
MPRVIKKTIQTTITQTGNSIVEETTTKVEISEDAEPVQIEKQTFFLDDEDEVDTWFQKNKTDDEDDSVDIYILDDDKSW